MLFVFSIFPRIFLDELIKAAQLFADACNKTIIVGGRT